VVIACLLAATVLGAGSWWRLTGGGATRGPATADAPATADTDLAERVPEREPAAPAPPGPSAEQVDDAVARAPVLGRDAVQALLSEAARRGETIEQPLDSALHIASLGFADIDRATLAELGRLLTQSWATRSAGDRARIQAYVRNAREGEPLSPDAIDAGRRLFVAGVRSLPAASQARLTALLGTAVAAGIAHRIDAEERSRVAALTPLTPAELPPPPSAQASAQSGAAPGAGSRSSPIGGVAGSTGVTNQVATGSDRGRGETYWRSRAERARAAVVTAESRLQQLEAEAARLGPVRPGALPAPCQKLTGRRPGDWEAKTWVECDMDTQHALKTQDLAARVEAARAQLKQAKQALEELEEEARRDGALPGWLR
jgi:hypothetical protein